MVLVGPPLLALRAGEFTHILLLFLFWIFDGVDHLDVIGVFCRLCFLLLQQADSVCCWVASVATEPVSKIMDGTMAAARYMLEGVESQQ